MGADTRQTQSVGCRTPAKPQNPAPDGFPATEGNL